MSIEIVKISHQTLGRNVLLYPLLRTLNVAETINRTIQSEAELPVGTIAELIILSRFAKERVPIMETQRITAVTSPIFKLVSNRNMMAFCRAGAYWTGNVR